MAATEAHSVHDQTDQHFLQPEVRSDDPVIISLIYHHRLLCTHLITDNTHCSLSVWSF
jgi:hypothetical protein